jgi:hypothetical protein
LELIYEIGYCNTWKGKAVQKLNLKKMTYNLTLTIPLAHGKNIPRVKTPRTGPPTMPKILKAA